MSNPRSDQAHPDPFDAREIAAEASALAAHLMRGGVQWLPMPSAEGVASLTQQFAVARQPSQSTSQSQREPEQPTLPADQVAAAPAPLLESDHRQATYPGDDLPAAQRQAALDEIAAQVAACQRCEILANCRTNTVFGEGSPTPRVVFFGEGPGADEDRSGRPFVGRAGQLLTKMIEACTFRRPDVYIMNTVKCRPPGNRNPEPDELRNCREYYLRQLAILRPEYIVCLGAVASQELMQNKLSVGKMRGQLHHYFESKVLVTYHPAYLLRTPAAKRAAWEDLQLLMRDAGIQVR